MFRLLNAQGKRPALLSSASGYGEHGRYSIVALLPTRHFLSGANPFEELREELTFGVPVTEKPQIPFAGGWIGFVSYEILARIEDIQLKGCHPFPLIELRFYPSVMVYDHFRQVWTCSHVSTGGPDTLAVMLDILETPAPPRVQGPALSEPLISNFTRGEYENMVRKALDYIAAGDIYQVNLSQRFSGTTQLSADEIACRLYAASPAPFGACLISGDRAIISSSPERFLKVSGRSVETRPIKGTRPRGITLEEDHALRRELVDSDKEKAELTMITDLLRNDLGRVCEYGSVEVAEARRVEELEHVFHTSSLVTGTLRPDADLVDLLYSTLPGGSITGTPKVRAMEIIDELEPVPRGPYCGSILSIGVDGNMDSNIIIRSLLLDGSNLSFQVGGGIVADSDPATEYDETMHKARGIMKALES